MEMQALDAKAALLAVAVTAVLYSMVYVKGMDKGEPLTEFYVLSADKKAEDYPLNLSAGEIGRVIVGIVNHEFKDVEYLLVVSYEGEVRKKTIVLRDSEKWEEGFDFAFNSTGRHKVEFRLYRGEEEPYRRLHLWVEVGG
jgi:uncharacterized membrane protein